MRLPVDMKLYISTCAIHILDSSDPVFGSDSFSCQTWRERRDEGGDVRRAPVNLLNLEHGEEPFKNPIFSAIARNQCEARQFRFEYCRFPYQFGARGVIFSSTLTLPSPAAGRRGNRFKTLCPAQ